MNLISATNIQRDLKLVTYWILEHPVEQLDLKSTSRKPWKETARLKRLKPSRGKQAYFVLAGLIFLLALHCEGANSELAIPVLPTNTQQLLDQIGKWDGVTQEATLEGPV